MDGGGPEELETNADGSLSSDETDGGMSRRPILIEENEIVPLDEITVSQGIKFKQIDEAHIKRERPPRYRLLLSILGIFSYTGVYVIDGLVLKELYLESRWLLFVFTLICFVVPTIVVQLLSLKWFHDDECLTWYTLLTHILCLGPVERYFYIFYHGIVARSKIKATSDWNADYKEKGKFANKEGVKNLAKYLVNWRDVSMLRFLYAFMESSPQATLQLYVIVDHIINNNHGNVTQQHIFAIIKVVLAFGALAVGIVSYNSDLRDSVGKSLSIPGYIFQCLYRILLLVSRVVVLVLFAMEFKLLVFAVLFLQWLLMIVWVRYDHFVFFTKEQASCNNACENLFQVILGYVYIFSYVATKDGSTAIQQTVYYILFHGQNICMMLAWIHSLTAFERTPNDFEMSAIAFVGSAMLLGIVFHAVYYCCFHPSCDRRREYKLANDANGQLSNGSEATDSFFRRHKEVLA